MFTGIPSFSLTHPIAQYTLRWFDPLTSFTIPEKEQQSLLKAQFYASAIASFYLLKTKELKQIKWQYEGKLASVTATGSDSEIVDIQIESQTLSESDSREIIFGENGILHFTETHQTRHGMIPMQDLLRDSAFFASQNLGTEMALTALPLTDFNNCLSSMPILQLTIPTSLTTDTFSALCNQLESPDFWDAIIQQEPQTLVDIGLIAWQLLGNDIHDPRLLCAKELLK